MNVRGLSNPIVSVENRQKVESSTVKMNESHQDRDPDGRRQQEEQDRSPLNEEEMEKAKKYLKSIEAIQSSELSFSVEQNDMLRILVIKDKEGNVVRRIPEYEMRELIRHQDEPSGKIFNKAG